MDEEFFGSDLLYALLVIPAFFAVACGAAFGTASAIHLGRHYHIHLLRPRAPPLPVTAPPAEEIIDMTGIALNLKLR